MEGPFLLTTAAELRNLAVIRHFVRRHIEALGIDPSIIYDVVVAVDEIATNVIDHGYQGRSGRIEVEVWTEGNALFICVRDEAPPFDPNGVAPPDIDLPLEERAPGGLGIHLARHFVDAIDYRKRPGGGNETTLIRRGIVPDGTREGPNAHDG